MKARIMLLGASAITVVLFGAMVQVAGWAQGTYVAKENEELYGTWTNEGNPRNDVFHPQKVVIAADRYELYLGISDSFPSENARVDIAEKWTDSKGNVWYKTFATITAGIYRGSRWQALDKLSKSGTIWERQLNPIFSQDFSPDKYPLTIDPKDSGNYRILYRADAGYAPKSDEELYGTWINEKRLPQKEVVSSDGWMEYNRMSDEEPFLQGKLDLVRKWTDAQGNIWYKYIFTITGGTGAVVGLKGTELSKLSKSATVWEHVGMLAKKAQDLNAFPNEIDPDDGSYVILYRAEK